MKTAASPASFHYSYLFPSAFSTKLGTRSGKIKTASLESPVLAGVLTGKALQPDKVKPLISARMAIALSVLRIYMEPAGI